ncbi:hypothetical protein [Kineococcus auxinigenes]|uniref:hypothetical protein n=1 Tax=unclassified Kineococcus TaxID=2621656 RepID=UPI003D7E7E39
MSSRHRSHPSVRAAAAGAVTLAALVLGGCGSQEEDLVDTVPDSAREAVVDRQDDATGVQPVHEGVLDGTFYEQVEAWDGQQVDLTAEVDVLVSPRTFLLVPEPGTEVDPLLVLSPTDVAGLGEGATVRVEGVLGAAFDLPRVEEDTGVDLQDDRYDDFDAEPYLVATSVEVVGEG